MKYMRKKLKEATELIRGLNGLAQEVLKLIGFVSLLKALL